MVKPAVVRRVSSREGDDPCQARALARCDEIRAVLADWQPEQHAEVLELIQRFARTLSKAPPERTPVPA